MLIYVLFILGISFILLGLFYLQPKEKDVSNIERTSKEMLNQLEDVTKNILVQIETKSTELKKLMLEIELLIDKAEKVKYRHGQDKRKKLTPLEEKQEKILSLLEQGKELVEIAKIMKMGKGEIQLVLDLGKTGWKKVENN